MHNDQQQSFITNVIQGFWPEWQVTQVQVDILKTALSYLEYGPTQWALQDWYISEKMVSKNPPINKIMQVLRKCWRNQRNKDKKDPILLYTIIKESDYIKGTLLGTGFYANTLPATEEIEKSADFHRQQASQIYGGNFIVIRNWEQPRPESKLPQTIKESIEARNRAWTDILTGEYDINNGKTKRWLTGYLQVHKDQIPAGIKLPEAEQLMPNTIGTIVAEEVFNPNPSYNENYEPPKDDIPF